MLRLSRSMWAVVPLILSVACADDVTQPAAELVGDKPQLDHTFVPSIGVNVNSFNLRMAPNEVFDGVYKGQYVFFAGQVAYGTDGEHVYFYDTRGGSQSFVDAGTAPFVDMGTHADHYTAALLFEADDQSRGPREHLEIITVRESFAFAAAPDDDYVIVRYTLNNTTDAVIPAAHLGFFSDADVVNAGENVTYFDESMQAAVTYDPRLPVRTAAVLLDPVLAHYQHWVVAGIGLGEDVTDPDSFVDWFELLSGTSDLGSLGIYDVRNAITSVPVDIPAHGSVTLSVALVGGDDESDLATNIAAARARHAAMDVPTATVHSAAVTLTAWEAFFTGRITFANEALAAAFVAQDAACGKAPVTVTNITDATVFVRFGRLDIDPDLSAGERVHCTGRLADGTYFAGHDSPPLPDSRLTITPVVVEASLDWAPTWAPDGHTVAFSSDRDGARAIFTLDLGVTGALPVRITQGLGSGEHAPDFSPDGSEIVFTRDGGIFAVDVVTGLERQLTPRFGEDGIPSLDFMPRWSPDGTQIVLRRQSSSNNIFVIPSSGDMDGSAAQQISNFLGVYPDWAADGRIYYTGAQSTAEGNSWAVYVYDPATGATERATPVEGSQNRGPALSPDGGTLAFTSGVALVLQDNALLRHFVPMLEPQVRLNSLGNQQNLEFSPDGSRLIFTSFDNDIWYVDLGTVVDPIARAEGLATSVQSLIDAGLLDAAGGAVLIASLENVATKLENGQIGAALNKVNAYINQVNALIRSRRVGEIEGQLLIDGGNALAEQIGG